MTLESTATVVGNLAIAASLIVALVFGLAQLRAAARDRKERLMLDVIRSFQTREFAAHLQSLRDHAPPKLAAEFYAMPVDDQVSFVHFAQQMEMLGIMVADGTIELDFVERTLGDFVTYAWSKYRSVIEDMRANNRDPYLGEYFQWLAEKIQAWMKTNPRTPAHSMVA